MMAARCAMILVLDNYDSFTYNLVQYLGELGAVVEVFRNDAIDPDGIAARDPEAILISPGPGTPDEAGVTLDVIRRFAGERPLLGVCLGHQAIAQVYGARIVRADRLMHGRTSPIEHDGKGVFAGLGSPLVATRYHSLIIDPDSLPKALARTAWTQEGEIMGVRHASLPVEGVQFHPESFLTEHGHAMLENFLAQLSDCGRRAGKRAA